MDSITNCVYFLYAMYLLNTYCIRANFTNDIYLLFWNLYNIKS